MQVRDVMTGEVVRVGPDSSAMYAAEIMADRGFAALPVLDGDGRLIGIVAEADVLRDRIPRDPRLHARRDPDAAERADPARLVRGVMTTAVRTVPVTADLADLARLFVDERLRSVPVLDNQELAGIVSRRDLLRALVRPDAEIRDELLGLVQDYTGALDSWSVQVADGVATIRRTRGTPDPSPEVEQRALTALAHTVGGVVDVRVPASGEPQPKAPPA